MQRFSHNLITFKSHQEALDDWALKEFTGHYVNYRRQLAEADQLLLPESAFRLHAVGSRFPHNLAQEVPWRTSHQGADQCRRGTDSIRVVVVRHLPQREPNALLLLLSASAEQVEYGKRHYRQHSPDSSTLILQLLKGYQKEGMAVPHTTEDFRRDFRKECIKDLTLQEQMEVITKLSTEQRVEGLSLGQRRADRPSGPPGKRQRK